MVTAASAPRRFVTIAVAPAAAAAVALVEISLPLLQDSSRAGGRVVTGVAVGIAVGVGVLSAVVWESRHGSRKPGAGGGVEPAGAREWSLGGGGDEKVGGWQKRIGLNQLQVVTIGWATSSVPAA